MVRKFKAKPNIVEAILFSGENYEEVLHFLYPAKDTDFIKGAMKAAKAAKRIQVYTADGIKEAEEWTWIVKPLYGEPYICTNNQFQRTFTEV